MTKLFPLRWHALPALLLCACLLLAQAAAGGFDPAVFVADESPEETGLAQSRLGAMTLHEKVCQLFFVQPEHFSRLDRVTAFSGRLKEALQRFPVGGVILFEKNLTKKSLACLPASLSSEVTGRYIRDSP